MRTRAFGGGKAHLFTLCVRVIYFKFDFLISVNVDSHTIMRTNTERSFTPFTPFTPVVLPCKTIVQYHNQDFIDIGIVPTLNISLPTGTLPLRFDRYAHFLPCHSTPATGNDPGVLLLMDGEINWFTLKEMSQDYMRRIPRAPRNL